MCRSQCWSYVKKEFQLKHFGFCDVQNARFGHAQWQLPVGVYLFYRFILAAYCVFWLIYLLSISGPVEIKDGTSIPQEAFLTIWTYFMLSLYLLLHFILCLLYCCARGGNPCSKPSAEGHRLMFNELDVNPSLWGNQEYDPIAGEDTDEEEMRMRTDYVIYPLPWYSKLVWILFSVATSCSVMVSIIFFIFLWPQMNTTGSIDMANFQLHAVNSMVIVLDSLLVAIPFRMLHIIYPVIYGLIYVVFSGIYYAVDHEHILYPKVLDWSQPTQTVLMLLLVAFVVIPLLHLIFFGIYKLKLFIYDKLNPQSL